MRTSQTRFPSASPSTSLRASAYWGGGLTGATVFRLMSIQYGTVDLRLSLFWDRRGSLVRGRVFLRDGQSITVQ
jgi:hypothetical protein